jgi:hypothetical protein
VYIFRVVSRFVVLGESNVPCKPSVLNFLGVFKCVFHLYVEANITNEEALGVLKLVPQLGITLSHPDESHSSHLDGKSICFPIQLRRLL